MSAVIWWGVGWRERAGERWEEVDGGREGCESLVDSNSTNPGEVWATARLRLSGSGCCQPLTHIPLHTHMHGRTYTQTQAHRGTLNTLFSGRWELKCKVKIGWPHYFNQYSVYLWFEFYFFGYFWLFSEILTLKHTHKICHWSSKVHWYLRNSLKTRFNILANFV